MLIGTLAALPLPPLYRPLPPRCFSNPHVPPWRCRPRRPRASRDPNAEDVRAGKSTFRHDGRWFSGKKEGRKWWSDEAVDDLEEEFDLFDEEPEQLWDKIWIFKVLKSLLKSYGYFLPAIIASILLASGPKAFLMALALPLGQSALSLAFDKLRGRESARSSPRTKSRKKPFNRYRQGFAMREEEITDNHRKTQQGNRSYAARSNGASGKGAKRTGVYGGWDELDGNKQFRKASPSAQAAGVAADSAPDTQAVWKGKLTSRGRARGMPLFVRLLVAVFPFLGSWTKFL